MAEDRKSALGDRLQNRLDSLRAQQKELCDDIAAIDNQIYDLETTFLNESNAATQIFGGRSIWLHQKPIDERRIDSSSSLTSPVDRAGGFERVSKDVEMEEVGPKVSAAPAHAPPRRTKRKSQSSASKQNKI